MSSESHRLKEIINFEPVDNLVHRVLRLAVGKRFHLYNKSTSTKTFLYLQLKWYSLHATLAKLSRFCS